MADATTATVAVTGEPVQNADQAKQILVKFGNMLLDTLQQGKDFVLEQAPLICQDIVRWGIAYNLYCAIVGVILMTCGLLLIFKRKEGNRFKDINWNTNDLTLNQMRYLGRAAGGIICFIIGCSWFWNIEYAIKAYFAPRLYIIDYLMTFVKSVK